MKSRFLRVAFSLILVAVSVSLLACATPTATPKPTPTVVELRVRELWPDQAFDVSTAQEAARTFLLPDDSKKVMSVNGRAVTKGEFLRAVIDVNAGLAFNERLAVSGRPGSGVSATQVALIKSSDVNTIAAAKVMFEAATLAEAERRGIKISDAKAKEFVAKNRALLASTPSPEIDAMIEILGEKRYWDELALQAAKDVLMSQELRKRVIPGAAYQPWSDFQRGLLESATVVIVDKVLLAGVDTANSIKYLQEVASLRP